jgi:hypothetical protein
VWFQSVSSPRQREQGISSHSGNPPCLTFPGGDPGLFLAMSLFFLGPEVGSLRDRKAAVDLIKEAGGRLLHLVPPFLAFPGGWVIEVDQEVGKQLGLLPWV